MNKTRSNELSDFDGERRAVDTETLKVMLSSGRQTAVQIGTAAGARIQVGRRVLWNVSKIQAYLDSVSE